MKMKYTRSLVLNKIIQYISIRRGGTCNTRAPAANDLHLCRVTVILEMELQIIMYILVLMHADIELSGKKCHEMSRYVR